MFSELYLSILESSLDEIYLRLDSKEPHWRLVSIWLQTVSTELYLRLDPKDRCFRLDSMKLTSDYVQWTLLESSLHDIYLRLDSKELHWRLVSIWLQTVSTELYLRLDPKDRCFRLDSMKLTSDYVQWTLLESSLHDIYLRLDSKELHWRLVSIWLQTAFHELYLRLHLKPSTETGLQRILLESAPTELYLNGLEEFDFRLGSKEIYLILDSMKLISDCIQWTLPGTELGEWTLLLSSLDEFYLRQPPYFAEKNKEKHFQSPVLKIYLKKMSKLQKKQMKSSEKSKKQWCSFDAVLKTASKQHQNCIKTASKLHQCFLDFSDDFICFFLSLLIFFK